MRRLDYLTGLAAAVLVSTACIAPTFPVTDTEVIRASDSTPVFGPGAEVRLGRLTSIPSGEQGNKVLRWDATKRSYIPVHKDELFRSLRIARLQAHSYLFQAETRDGYKLVLMRVSPTGDASPLGCGFNAAKARAAGVELQPSEGESNTSARLTGTRAAIIAFLSSELQKCTPMLKFTTFIPPSGVLPSRRPTSKGSVDNFLTRKARLAGCRPCGTRACITGVVQDFNDRPIPEATTTVIEPTNDRVVASGTSNSEGRFFIAGIPQRAPTVFGSAYSVFKQQLRKSPSLFARRRRTHSRSPSSWRSVVAREVFASSTTSRLSGSVNTTMSATSWKKNLRPLALILALAMNGCLVPLLPVTETEVIRAEDSTAVFGPRGEFRFLNAPTLSNSEDLGTVINWDPKTRVYVSADLEDGLLRVARLMGDTYLIQAQAEEVLGSARYALVIARVSPTGDVTPLGCDLTAAAAKGFGVGLVPHEEFAELVTEVQGDRVDIVALLKSELPKCKPLSKFDVFIPPTTTLAATPSANDTALKPGVRSWGCRSCPSGGCIQGYVTDNSGMALPGVNIRVKSPTNGRNTRVGKTDRNGRFFVDDVPVGSYVLSAEAQGFGDVDTGSPFDLTAGRTYVFQDALQLASGKTPVTRSQKPYTCVSDSETNSAR